LWIRGRYPPWVEHPVWGHRPAMRHIRALPPDVSPARVRAGFPRPTAAAFAAFHRLRYRTLVADQSIGEYVEPLKDAARWADDPQGRARLLHAYHHGAALAAGAPELAAVRALGATLAKIGGDVIAYQTPVPVESGRAHFGAAFD